MTKDRIYTEMKNVALAAPLARSDGAVEGINEIIEAYGAGIPVKISPVRFGDNYWGAQRFLTR